MNKLKMRRRWIIVFIYGVFIFGGCGSGADIRSNPDITCECEGLDKCPVGRCDFKLEFAENCYGEIDKAEILINDYLEPKDLTPGQSLRSCYSITSGSTATIIVRSDDWQWGPSVHNCKVPGGGSIPLIFECCECQQNQDCIKLLKGDTCKDCRCSNSKDQ